MRPIDADVLLEKLHNVLMLADITNEEQAVRTIKSLIECVSEQPTVQRWVLCSEIFPNPGAFVLVTTASETLDCCYLDYHGTWISPNEDYSEDDIIAWMPLPKPYGVQHE